MSQSSEIHNLLVGAENSFIARLEELADGAVLRWRQAYHRGYKTYRFAAVKADGKWWITDGAEFVECARLARRLMGKAGMPAATDLRVADEGGW